MVTKESKKKPPETTGMAEHQIAGFNVRIGQVAGQEQLLIDGKPVKFHNTKAGFLLNTNMFVEPQETLLDAVKLYLERQAT